VTDEQRSQPAIFLATERAAVLSAPFFVGSSLFSVVGI